MLASAVQWSESTVCITYVTSLLDLPPTPTQGIREHQVEPPKCCILTYVCGIQKIVTEKPSSGAGIETQT